MYGQFLGLSLVILVVGMTTIGLWIQAEVKESVMARTAGVTALYVDSFVAPLLSEMADDGGISERARDELDALLADTGLGREIVAFKVWAPDGTVVYSQDPQLEGVWFEPEPGLIAAFGGDVVSELSSLDKAENALEAQLWDELIETYAPVRADGVGDVIAVSEFYQRPDALLADISAARLRSWAIVGAATLLMYLLLAGIVRRASGTIARQRSELEHNVADLRAALEENQRLHDRTRHAAERTTEVNERYLARISADLHDGPAQSIALALLRLDAGSAVVDDGDRVDAPKEVRHALDSALTDLRFIARGLRLPELEGLSPTETIHRAVEDISRITGRVALLDCRDLPETLPLSVKMTLYRVLYETLSNSVRHAPSARSWVSVAGGPVSVTLEVGDDGPGFDPDSDPGHQALGLAGLRDRVRVLGGSFSVASAAATGTVVRVVLPRVAAEEPADG
ncbi:MAG: sensor histidine kinase [Acidimicrobiia bacterium]|nr:sensor histidine kinase [Acidimicrobiia bacterium]